jgi:PleD family two-component response regulator
MAERPPVGQVAPELLAANQQLVLAALRAQTDADAATEALDRVSRAADIDMLTDLPNRAYFPHISGRISA